MRDKRKSLYNEKGVYQTRSNICISAQNSGASKHTKQILTDIEGEKVSSTLITGDFNTSFSSMDTSSRENKS